MQDRILSFLEADVNTNHSFISEPVLTTLDGESVLSAKVFSQIQNSLGQRSGIAGIDIVLSGLDGMMDGESIFHGTKCEFITSSGAVLASTNHTDAGNPRNPLNQGTSRITCVEGPVGHSSSLYQHYAVLLAKAWTVKFYGCTGIVDTAAERKKVCKSMAI